MPREFKKIMLLPAIQPAKDSGPKSYDFGYGRGNTVGLESLFRVAVVAGNRVS
jgi:hypothetical protein